MSLCACGCGAETPIATKTDSRRGIVKGQAMRFLPGHNAVQKKRGIKKGAVHSLAVESTAPERVEITAKDIERLRLVDKQDAAHAYTIRMNYLDARDKRTFVERGLIVRAVDEGELWRRVIDNETGEPYRSTNQWIAGECPTSQSTCFDAWAAMKRLKDVPVDEVKQMSRSNVKQLAKTSTAVRRDPDIILAAQTQQETEFIETVNKKYPDQRLEPNAKLVMKPTKSARSQLDRGIEAAMLIFGATVREEALEGIIVEWLDSPCQDERFKNLTNNQAYVALLASGKRAKKA